MSIYFQITDTVTVILQTVRSTAPGEVGELFSEPMDV